MIIKIAEEALLHLIIDQEEEVLLPKEIIGMKKLILNMIINMKEMINMINMKEDQKMKEKIEMKEIDPFQKIMRKKKILQTIFQIMLIIMIIMVPHPIILIRIRKKSESQEILHTVLIDLIDQIDLQEISKNIIYI